METIVGLAMIYAWIHGAVIVGKKTENLTQYEGGVLIAAAVGVVLYVLGTL